MLLCKGDVGVDQTPGDAAENKEHKILIPHQLDQSRGRFLPDIQAQEVGPGEYVVSSKHHPDVGHQDVLHTEPTVSRIRDGPGGSGGLTLIQPMMEVVSAELCCVHSRMEYIRTKLRDRESNQGGAEPRLSRLRGTTLPHDAGEDKLHRKHRVPPPAEGQSLRQTQSRASARRRRRHTNADAEAAHHLQVTGVVGVGRGRQRHDQGVVIEEPVFAQLLRGEAAALPCRR